MEIDYIGIAKNILAVIGILSIILVFLDQLFKVVPNLTKLKTGVAKYLSETLNFVFLRRAAIKSDVENTVNNVVFQLQEELPRGWVKKASIKWVRTLEQRDQLPEGELILRIRPHSSEENNLMYAVSYFFESILFPKASQAIPKRKIKASTLLISRRALTLRNPSFKSLFNETVLEEAIKTDGRLMDDFGKFEKMDNLGFFTSAYLREMNAIAKQSLYTEMRTKIDSELNKVLKHMSQFVLELASEKGQIKLESQWSRIGPVTSYAFLLVARPNNSGTSPYVNKALERRIEGVNRLYVLAREDQKHFARQVVAEIKKTGEYEIEDVFSLHRDYRCNHGGYGAVFVAKSDQEPV